MASGLPPKVEPCVPAVIPLAASAVGEARPDRKTAAERLGERHDVRFDADTLIGEQLAGTTHAGLHFVEQQEQSMLIAELAQGTQERRLDDAHAAFAHDRFDEDRAGLGGDRGFGRFQIAERHLIETLDMTGPNPSRYFFCPPAASVASVRPWKAPSKVMIR